MTSLPTPDQAARLKERGRELLAGRREQLLEFSHRLAENPELAWEEVRASRWLAAAAEGAPGARVRRGLGEVPTAVRAEAGGGELTVTVCSEYDALPGIGHGCGHNIIAAIGLGTFLVLAELAAELGITVRLLGTPAEENGGGKILMLEQGEFEGTHLACMVHPMNQEWANMNAKAIATFQVRYAGRAAHASMAPWEGINAQDAMVVAQTAIALARQQFRPGQQVHCAVSGDGGAANVIPQGAAADVICRGDSLTDAEDLAAVVRRCFEAGAMATGAELTVEDMMPAYSHMESDVELEDRWIANLAAVGRTSRRSTTWGASTDMANVSLQYPTIHPLIKVVDGQPIHTAGFAECAASPAGDQAVMDGAYGLIATAIDAATEPELRARLLRGERRLAGGE